MASPLWKKTPDCFYVHELDAMVLQLGYDGVDEPMYYHYLRPMTDLDVEHGINKLNCYYTSNSQIRATIEEYHKDMGVEASSTSPKKNLLLMLEWYANSTPVKASSNIWSVTPKSIPHGLFIHACDETMILVGQISGVYSCVTKTSDLPRVSSQFESISQAFETYEKTMGDVIEDAMRRFSFDITNIDDHLDIISCDAVYFAGLCHEELSHDETFGIDDLDPPLPFDLNIPAHVSTDEGIISDHANVQDRFDEELGYVNELDDVNHASVSEDNHHGNTTRVDEHLENDNAPLENATSIVNHRIPVKDVQDILQRELEVHISMSKAFRANAKADKEIKGFLKQGFKAGKREILGLDGGIYERPLSRISVNSSGNRCIIPTIKHVYPSAEHRFCLRHIHENIKKGWRGKLFKECLWKCAAATITVAFERCMNELKSLNVGAHD
ncbi:hypothetical protein Tco_1027614 [Tanacetum coccineum]